MKNKKVRFIIYIMLSFVILGFIYFQLSLIVPPDGSTYYLNTTIFDGVKSLSEWDVIRGPSFPFLLFIFKHVFGSNPTGILIGFFIIYLLFCVFSVLFLKQVLNHYRKGKCNIIYWLLLEVLIIFNPLMIGYSHTLLTEAVAPTFIMLSALLVYRWKDIFWNSSKCKTIIYIFVFSLITIFMWFLKQPYMPIIIFLLGIMAILVGLRDKSWKKFLEKIFSIFIILIMLVLAIFTWSSILKHSGIKNSDNNSSFIVTGIIQGLNGHYREISENDKCNIDYINSLKITEKERRSLNNFIKNNKEWCQHINIYDIIGNQEQLVGQTILIYSGKAPSMGEVIKFLIKNSINHPTYILSSYYRNYMATINIFDSNLIEHKKGYIPGNKYNPNAKHENSGLGLQTYRHTVTCWWQYQGWENAIKEREDVKLILNFSGETKHSQNFEKFVFQISPFYLNLFKILFLLALPLALYSFIRFLKDRENDIYLLATTLYGASFLHVLFHAVFGAIIDRYAVVVYPLVLLATILLLIKKKSTKEVMEVSEMLNEKHKKIDKTIFVIPAYNEAKHIENVIMDIKKNMPKADIVITNDSSIDNTQQIVEKLGITCLNHPYNMGYAASVQTGIKYAYENDYDYVVQFDADGQHLASEAKKLFETMKKTDADIVIGSRFLVETDYNHPFFRKIGTKMFQIMIKLFCQKKITDPTSGFQLLNRKVISRYAQIGKYPEFPDANLIIEMLLNGYKIEEVSVKMKENDEGKSMHGGIIKPIKYMVNVTYSVIFILLQGMNIRKGSK